MEFSKHTQGTTSIGVQQRPGGTSTIQIGGGYGEDKSKDNISGKIGAGATVPTATKPVDEEEEKKDEEGKTATPTVTAP